MKGCMFTVAAAAALFLGGAARAQPYFTLDFDCPDEIKGYPGEVKTFEFFARLTTSGNTYPEGAQGWNIGFSVSGGTLDYVTLEGVTVSTIYDKNVNGVIQHLDPYIQDLGASDMYGHGAEKAYYEPNPSILGAVSWAALRAPPERMTLQPNGRFRLMKGRISVIVPPTDITIVSLEYSNGLCGSTVGQPASNDVTFHGSPISPYMSFQFVQVYAPPPPKPQSITFSAVPAGMAPAPSGDTELVLNALPGLVEVPVDILLTSVYSDPGGGPLGWSLSIANDPCMNVSYVTLNGVVVPTIYLKYDPASGGKIVIDPQPKDLSAADFSIAEKAAAPSPPDTSCPCPDGAAVGVVSYAYLDIKGDMMLHPNSRDAILRINYTVPVVEGKTTDCWIRFLDCLKSTESPVLPMENRLYYGSESMAPTKVQNLHVKITSSKFMRGDPNADSATNISDVLAVLGYLYLGVDKVPCEQAGDVNDDGFLNITDAIHFLNFMFLGGKAIEPPFGFCGFDPTGHALPCASFDPCTGGFASLGPNTQGYSEYQHNQTGIIFVSLPGGKFNMGSPGTESGRKSDEGPVHEVTLSPFLIAKYEVTQAQWKTVMGSNPSRYKGDDNRPVEQVSWDQIQEFESKTGLALPTEAQWEYACRAGTAGPYAGTGNLGEMGWYGDNSGYTSTFPVGQKQPNQFGLHDMHGNVYEWCEDVYYSIFYSRPEASGQDPVSTSGSELRVARGGAFPYGARFCRSASRYNSYPIQQQRDLGFRPVVPIR